MQYRIPIAPRPELRHLWTALSEHLEVSIDPAAAEQVAPGAGPQELVVGSGGHVIVRADITPAGVWLQIDGNRHKIRLARGICEAWIAAFGSTGTPSADAPQSFARALSRLLDG